MTDTQQIIAVAAFTSMGTMLILVLVVSFIKWREGRERDRRTLSALASKLERERWKR